jgi:uncharacterized membrane protein
MSVATSGMIGAGVAALVAGLGLVRGRVAVASGVDKVLVLGPVFEAVSLAIFAAEHFLMARDLSGVVPRWLPGAMFWTYFFGVALLAATVSFIVWRCVRLSASLLAVFFLIIVATVDLPNLPASVHDRMFWILTVRETCFAAGAMVLAGSVWARGSSAGRVLVMVGRFIVACTFVFYAVQHFLHPRNVPGVPLEKMIPGWVPAPVVLACFVGATLLVAGVGLMITRANRIAAAGAGVVLVLLVVFFYVPILMMEIHTSLAVEGINYVGDTLLFAGTALLAGFGGSDARSSEPGAVPVEA